MEELSKEALEYFREKGRKGGNTTFKRHGMAHIKRMSELAKIARKKKHL